MQSRRALLTLPLLAATAAAQTTFDGDAAGVRLGERFDVIADVNADGVYDLLAGFPEDDTQGLDAGRALVLSGADGSVLRQHFGQAAGDRFGEVVVGLDDFDSDGLADYAVSATGFAQAQGAVYAFSNATGAELHQWVGNVAGDRFGTAVDRVGDVNGDNRRDLAIGAPGVDLAGSQDDGTVYVYSGVSGFLLRVLEPQVTWHERLEFGTFVSWIGDLNNDGFNDVFAATPENDVNFLTIGHIAVFSGVDGSVLYSATGLDGGHGDFDYWGSGIDGAGDVNADGVPDFLIGISLAFNGHHVVLLDGASTQELWREEFFAPGDYLGDPTNVGDVSGDGVPDQAFLMPFDATVRIRSGAGGLVLQNITSAELGFGATIRGVQDVTGDGIRDLALGIPGFDGPAGAGAGQIRIYPGNPCAQVFDYCVGGVNSTGMRAEISHAGSASVSANDLVLVADKCPPNKPGLFFYGPQQVFTPLGDGFQCVGPGALATYRLNPAVAIDGAGHIARPLDLNAPPANTGGGAIEAGNTWYFQFWFRDPSGPGGGGFNLSDGLGVPFCP
jgi:hypothetical protein